MAQSHEEKLEKKKRNLKKKRYDKLKNDPKSSEKLKAQRREKYEKAKLKKLQKPVTDSNTINNRRMQWRVALRKYREKKKSEASRLSADLNLLCDSTQETSSDSEAMKDSEPKSPEKRVKKNEEEVARSLLFAEVLKDQLKTNYEQLTGNEKKQNFRAGLSGKFTEKYRVTNYIRNIVAGNKLRGWSKNIQTKFDKKRNKTIHAISGFSRADINSTMCPRKKDYCSKNGKVQQKR